MGRFWGGIGGILLIVAGFGFLIGFLEVDISLINQDRPQFYIARDIIFWNRVSSFLSFFIGIILLVSVAALDVDVKKAEKKQEIRKST